MVGAGDVVADRLGRVAAEEDRASVADARRQAFGAVLVDRQLDVLGGDAIDDRARVHQLGHHGHIGLHDRSRCDQVGP